MSNFLLHLAARFSRLLPVPIKKALYRLGPVTKSLRSILNRAAPEGLDEVEVAAGDLQGARLLLDLHSEKDYWLGTYELQLQEAIQRWVRPGWTAYDLGANIGYISLLLARAVGSQGKVLAVEALPTNLERLRNNISLNQQESVVSVLAGAVTQDEQPVTFWVGPSGGMGKANGSAGRDLEYKTSIVVPGVCLDLLVYRDTYPLPQVIKMDIEGGEVLALPGMQRLLDEGRPIMLVELHGEEAAGVVWKVLTGAGYRVCGMAARYPEVKSLAELDWKAYVVAIPAEQYSSEMVHRA